MMSLRAEQTNAQGFGEFDNSEIADEFHKQKERKYPVLFIVPQSTISLLWESIINTSTLISLIIVPYAMAFGIEENYTTTGTVIDVIFFLDMLLTFITGYYAGNEIVVDRKRIAFRYLKTFFLFDTISTLPSLFSGQNTRVYFLKLLRFVHVY